MATFAFLNPSDESAITGSAVGPAAKKVPGLMAKFTWAGFTSTHTFFYFNTVLKNLSIWKTPE
jgi:hypothetical protein